MKYYYAVVHCNNAATAMHIYDEYNGFEFEDTNIRLNMSLIPDDVKFEQELKDECSGIPEDYEFDFNKLNRAMGHSNVKLTWDQSDKRRAEKLKRGFMMGDDVD